MSRQTMAKEENVTNRMSKSSAFSPYNRSAILPKKLLDHYKQTKKVAIDCKSKLRSVSGSRWMKFHHQDNRQKKKSYTSSTRPKG